MPYMGYVVLAELEIGAFPSLGSNQFFRDGVEAGKVARKMNDAVGVDSPVIYYVVPVQFGEAN